MMSDFINIPSFLTEESNILPVMLAVCETCQSLYQQCGSCEVGCENCQGGCQTTCQRNCQSSCERDRKSVV